MTASKLEGGRWSCKVLAMRMERARGEPVPEMIESQSARQA